MYYYRVAILVKRQVLYLYLVNRQVLESGCLEVEVGGLGDQVALGEIGRGGGDWGLGCEENRMIVEPNKNVTLSHQNIYVYFETKNFFAL